MNEEAALDAHIASCRKKIAEHGHMVAAIGYNHETNTPQFAYTIGVWKYCGFEFVISGLPIDDMHTALNDLANRARDRKLKPSDGLLVEGVFQHGYLTRLRPVAPGWHFGWINSVLVLPAPIPMWQAQYPDRMRRFPGEASCELEPVDQTDFTVPPADPEIA